MVNIPNFLTDSPVWWTVRQTDGRDSI